MSQIGMFHVHVLELQYSLGLYNHTYFIIFSLFNSFVKTAQVIWHQ